ncbi:MAG: LLM class flavin-dependent oxidoreductase [Sphingobium sp.]
MSAGRGEPTALAMRNLLEAICLADELGLDYFGVGEHHTDWAPVSAAPVLLAAAASRTKQIRLGSAVTVLSTEDPVRLYQQFATLDAIASGRAEIIAGRGSSTESFPLFGYDLADYDALFAEKLELLLQLDRNEAVTWEGRFRSPLKEARIVPRAHCGRLSIWLGTGGSAASSIRAGQLGLPICYGIIGGPVARFAPLVDLYHRAAREAGHGLERLHVAVASPGFIAADGRGARDLWWRHWCALLKDVAGSGRGVGAPDRRRFEADASAGGALFVGSPEEVAERIVLLHREMGHDRHFFQMDIGHLPQRDFLHAIELLGTRVKPLVDAELGSRQTILQQTVSEELR